jgi:hypothetical protein
MTTDVDLGVLPFQDEIATPGVEGTWRAGRFREMIPCPTEYRYAHVGDCEDCGRPMAAPAQRRRLPCLRAYFVQSMARTNRCKNCHQRNRDGLGPTRPPTLATPDRRMSDAQLDYLRSLVPCRGCDVVLTEVVLPNGQAAVIYPHKARCPTAGIPEG